MSPKNSRKESNMDNGSNNTTKKLKEANENQVLNASPINGSTVLDKESSIEPKQQADSEMANGKRTLFESRPSMLSSEYSANSYRGFINLLIILLVRSQQQRSIT